MSILRKYLIESLRKTYNNVSYTYGYEIKEPDGIYLYKKVRCHNRQIHKFKTLKGGIRKLNQALHNSRIRLFDKVRINNHTGFIYGRRQSGPCLVKDIDGNIISSGISYKS